MLFPMQNKGVNMKLLAVVKAGSREPYVEGLPDNERKLTSASQKNLGEVAAAVERQMSGLRAETAAQGEVAPCLIMGSRSTDQESARIIDRKFGVRCEVEALLVGDASDGRVTAALSNIFERLGKSQALIAITGELADRIAERLGASGPAIFPGDGVLFDLDAGIVLWPPHRLTVSE